MIQWFLLLTVAAGQPQTTVYSTEKDACQAYLTAKAGGPAFIYELSGHRDTPEIHVGDCKPVQQFLTTK